jgi:hypothetical protein
MLSHQDGCRSAVALFLKAALIQVVDFDFSLVKSEVQVTL